MNKLLASDKIYISKSKIPSAGRGVFAKVNIKKGEIIETCPVIEVPKKDTSLLVESALTSYFYFLGKKKEKTFLVLGFGSIYNHSESPNAIYKESLKGKTVNFIASRNIKRGEEILVNYDPEGGKIPLWFKSKK